MYRGYLELGGKEIANTARLTAYLATLGIGVPFRPGIDIENLDLALGDAPYREPAADEAPWVDGSNPASKRFYGLHILEAAGIGDSTSSAVVTESIRSGGSVGGSRDATMEMRFRVLLVGADDLALEAGWTWLKGALRADSCGSHGAACGTADLCYFLAKPIIYPDMVGPDFDLDESIDYFTVAAGSPVVYRPLTFAGPRRATWTPAVIDGAQIRFGALALESTREIEASPTIYLRRSNYLANPRFVDASGWTVTDGTLTPAGTGTATYAELEGTPAADYNVNWFPDPSFENGDPETMGYRSTTAGGITRVVDGTAPDGTHVAVIDGIPDETMFEVTALGPDPDSGLTAEVVSLSIAANADDVLVEVFDDDGELVDSATIDSSELGSAWNYVDVTLDPIYTGYVVRFSTAGTQDLRVDTLMLSAAAGAFFDGDTPDAAGVVYSFVGGDPAAASRSVDGTEEPFEVESDATVAPAGADILTFEARAPYGGSIVVELLDAADVVVGTTTVTPPGGWARYSLSVTDGLGTKVRVSGTGLAHVTRFLLERGNDILPYCDGLTAAPSDYAVSTVAGVARMEYVGDFVTELDYPEWRPFFEVLSENPLSVVNLFYEEHSPVDLDECVAPYERRLHDVACIQGPRKTRDYQLGSAGFAREAVFLLAATTPYVFSNSRPIELGPLETAFFSDRVINLSENPSAEEATTGYTAIPGTTGVAALTNPVSATEFGDRVLRCTWSTASTAAGGGAYQDYDVTEGNIYSFGYGHVKPSITNRLQLQVEWRTDVGTISTDTSAPQTVIAAGVVGELTVEDLEAPATATIARVKVISVAGTSYANWSIASYLELDGAMGNFGEALADFFDGDTVNTPAYEYAWTGVEGLSTSTKSLYVEEPAGELVDPNLPPVPDAPTVPFIPDPAVEDQPNDWLRYYAQIPGEEVAGWADTVPTVVLASLAEAVRFVRFRITPNPFGFEPEQVDPTAFCAEFILSYLPAFTELTVDGSVQRAWAEVAGGQPQAAEQLLYATDGSPMTWPEMSCNIDYLLTIDVPAASTLENLDVALSLTKRE